MGSLLCRIPQELARTAWITTATCHTRDIRKQGHWKWTLIGQLASTWRCVCSFVDFCWKNLLCTGNIVMLILPHSSDVKAECLCTQAWVSHGMSCLWNHILAWNVFGPFRCEQVSSSKQFLSVDFSHVNNSGLCDSHLVNLLSRWLLRHGTLIVHLKLSG